MFLQVGTSQRDNHRPLQKELPSRLEDLPRPGQPGPARPSPSRTAARGSPRPSPPLASLLGARVAALSAASPAWRPARTQVRGLRVRSAPGPPEAARARRGGEERLGRAAGEGRRVPGPRRERSRAGSRARGGRRQVGRTSRERASEGGRAREGPGGGAAGRMAQLFLNIKPA